LTIYIKGISQDQKPIVNISGGIPNFEGDFLPEPCLK